jgi:hypothetical protein
MEGFKGENNIFDGGFSGLFSSITDGDLPANRLITGRIWKV